MDSCHMWSFVLGFIHLACFADSESSGLLETFKQSYVSRIKQSYVLCIKTSTMYIRTPKHFYIVIWT